MWPGFANPPDSGCVPRSGTSRSGHSNSKGFRTGHALRLVSDTAAVRPLSTATVLFNPLYFNCCRKISGSPVGTWQAWPVQTNAVAPFFAAKVFANASTAPVLPRIILFTSPYEIVHVAIQQGEIAGHNVAHPENPRQIDYRLITSVVFTEPQLATVGLTEKSAQAGSVPYLAASYPFRDHGKALIMEAKDGFVKLLANPEQGEIVGGCCIGPMGGELIHEIIAAMHKRMTVHELASMPHYHPTLAEIWTYPAEELAEKIPQ